MDHFKKELQKLSADKFTEGKVTPWEKQGQYDPDVAQHCYGHCHIHCHGHCHIHCHGHCHWQHCHGHCHW